MLHRLVYFFEKAAASVRASFGLSLLTSGTIGTALVVLGSYAMALQNIEGLALVWGRSATLVAYIDDSVPKDKWQGISEQILEHDAISIATLVTPVESLKRFRARSPHARSLVVGVDADILPASIAVDLKRKFTPLDRVKRVAEQIEHIEGIADVDYGRTEFERLQALLLLLRYGGIGAGILLALATALIVSNTIRLTLYARRDEIVILRLMGATAWFIRTPVLFEGALWGATGGILSILTLSVGELFLAPRLTTALADVLGGLGVHLISIDVAQGMLASGMLLGVLGSALAVRRFLKADDT